MHSTTTRFTLVALPTLALLLTSCSDSATGNAEAEPQGETATDSGDTVEENVEADGLRVAVATNEPWGTYHVEDVSDDVAARDGALDLIVPDMSEVEEDEIDVVGVPELDEVPQRDPESNTVLILTSVTHPDETGGAAPGAELLLNAAHALDDEGYDIVVGLHPREDESLWDEFKIAEEGSVEASVRAEVAVGIPGSVFPRIAAIGTPLVGTMDPELDVPEYLTTTGTMVESVDDVLSAVENAEPLSDDELEYVVGPLGQAGPDLVRAWNEGAEVDPADADL